MQPRDKAAMLVVNTKEIFLLNLHQNRVHFPAERNAFVLDHQHGRRDVTCKPAIKEYMWLLYRIQCKVIHLDIHCIIFTWRFSTGSHFNPLKPKNPVKLSVKTIYFLFTAVCLNWFQGFCLRSN